MRREEKRRKEEKKEKKKDRTVFLFEFEAEDGVRNEMEMRESEMRTR